MIPIGTSVYVTADKKWFIPEDFIGTVKYYDAIDNTYSVRDNLTGWNIWVPSHSISPLVQTTGTCSNTTNTFVRCKDCLNLMMSDCYGECRQGYLGGIVIPMDGCTRGMSR